MWGGALALGRAAALALRADLPHPAVPAFAALVPGYAAM
jgi:hypothetical protein